MDHMTIALASFPEEIIMKIFEFCDIQSLGRLACTCEKFKRIIYTEDCVWRERSRYALGSNMIASSMQRRCKPNFSFKKRCEISKKWLMGLGTKRIILRHKRCMPWLSLEQNHLFCSKEEMIVQFNRDENGNAITSKVNKVMTSALDDVSKFAVNENEIVSGGRDGTLSRWRKSDLRSIHFLRSHSSDIHCVDTKGDIIISGSRDCFIKIWKAYPNDTVCQKAIDMNIRVLSTAIMPSSRYFIVGLPGINDIHPLQLFDLETGEYITNFGDTFRFGAGILDIYPEFDNTFITCGYDTTVRLWDIRCPKNSVADWMEPFDNGIYCVRSDHNITIVSGAYRNGVIHVWDKRWSVYKKVYYTSEYNSPVYCIAFDASHIFAAFDKSIHQFSYI